MFSMITIKKLVTFLSIGFVLSLLVANKVLAVTYYVAGDIGDDSRNTTEAQDETTPWETIQKAADNVTAGDIVNVKGGITYTDINTCLGWSSGESATVCLKTSGSSGNYITYRAWPGTGTPIVDTAGLTGSGFSTEGLSGGTLEVSYNIIEGFEIINSTDTSEGNNPSLVKISGLNNSNIIVKNNIIRDSSFYQEAVSIMSSSGDNIQFINNTINNSKEIVLVNMGSLGVSFVNNIISNNDYGFYSPSSFTVDLSHNLLWNNENGNYINIDEGATDIVDQDPQFIDAANNDLKLMDDSPAINAGTEMSEVDTDILGVSRPQYSVYDIGAYEYYQVPVTILVYQPDWSINSFRWQGTASTPISGATVNNIEYSIDNGSWTSSGVTASDGDFDEASEEFVISFSDDLSDGYHDIRIRGVDSNLIYSLSSIYATDTFGVDATAPNGVEIIYPKGESNNYEKPTLVFSKTDDDLSGIYSYKVELDPGKEYGFSVEAIPANGNRGKNNIPIDNDKVRVTFVHEDDDNPDNDKIKVFFKDLEKQGLVEGEHFWKVIIRDNAGNEKTSGAHFYIDRTNPYFDEPITIDRSTHQLIGRAIDPYSVSTMNNLEKVASGPRKIMITYTKDGVEIHSQEHVFDDEDVHVYMEDGEKKNKYVDFVINLDQIMTDSHQIQIKVIDDVGNESEVFSADLQDSVSSIIKLEKEVLDTGDKASSKDESSVQEEESQRKQKTGKLFLGLVNFIILLLVLFYLRKRKKGKIKYKKLPK